MTCASSITRPPPAARARRRAAREMETALLRRSLTAADPHWASVQESGPLSQEKRCRKACLGIANTHVECNNTTSLTARFACLPTYHTCRSKVRIGIISEFETESAARVRFENGAANKIKIGTGIGMNAKSTRRAGLTASKRARLNGIDVRDGGKDGAVFLATAEAATPRLYEYSVTVCYMTGRESLFS
ncbi:hypothetical protein EVAR_12355_1 [Eumeta japonica]|uniref:Uncharacterized protein n=1 Tax=Eumeta variegata TaxID=151549 RepID=A0A4C1WYQ0_EUMVA|nr:hypothetical protein EVAR_12355_1 [Eumeta japonica]